MTDVETLVKRLRDNCPNYDVNGLEGATGERTICLEHYADERFLWCLHCEAANMLTSQAARIGELTKQYSTLAAHRMEDLEDNSLLAAALDEARELLQRRTAIPVDMHPADGWEAAFGKWLHDIDAWLTAHPSEKNDDTS